MNELAKEVVKVIEDGDIVIANLIDIESESNAIAKRFPFLSFTEKKEAIKRYKYLKSLKPSCLEQIALIKEFLLNTVNDLSSLETGWLEKRLEKRTMKKLESMMQNEIEVEKEKDVIDIEKENVLVIEPEVEVKPEQKTEDYVITEEAKEALRKDIEEIQAQKKNKK